MMTVEEKPDITYNDIGGNKDEIQKLREVLAAHPAAVAAAAFEDAALQPFGHEIAVERAAIVAQRRLNHLFSRAVMQQLPDSKKRLDPVFAVESTLTQVRFAGVGQGADRSEPFQQAFRKLPGIRAERREQTGQMVRSIRDRR